MIPSIGRIKKDKEAIEEQVNDAFYGNRRLKNDLHAERLLVDGFSRFPTSVGLYFLTDYVDMATNRSIQGHDDS